MAQKTRKQVREEFARQGWSISSWARARNYSSGLVQEILSDDDAKPKRKCLRGESHNIAVDLGLKQGVVSRQIPRLMAA